MTKLYWLSHCGNHAIERTSCMVEVEHFTTIEARNKRLDEIVRLHERDSDEVESYQYGEVSAPKPDTTVQDELLAALRHYLDAFRHCEATGRDADQCGRNFINDIPAIIAKAEGRSDG